MKGAGRANIQWHREKFVEALFRNGMNQTAAYAEIFPNVKDPKSMASRMANHPWVKGEIEKRRVEQAKKTGDTVETSIQEAEEAKQFAIKHCNPNAYVKAVELKAKLKGHLVEKHDHRMVGGFQINIVGVSAPPAIPIASSVVPVLPRGTASE